MAFQVPITIRDVLAEVHAGNYLLPAIQREFVWKPAQIESLFDSILRGYPIGSFLFWQVDHEHRGKYQFYEFIRKYHERDQRHNPKADVSGTDGLTAILDGQQRLTALYIGLRGSYAGKVRGKWWSSDDAFPEKRLHLNLSAPASDWDGGFQFKFLTDAEVAKAADKDHWFRVSKVLDFESHKQLYLYLQEAGLTENTFAYDSLFDLHEAVNNKQLINYFLERDQDLDKVLNIFIRVNSGGTQLSYSDLLLSVATAQWDKLDAREEINNLVDALNQTSSEGFGFDKDFVLKACLALADISSVQFNVKNFTHENMRHIESMWPEIEERMRQAVGLVASLGFTEQTLTSNNSVIPLAYYLHKRAMPGTYVESTHFSQDRQVIRHWLITNLIKGTFGDQADTVLQRMRSAIQETDGGFPVNEINSRMLQMNKSIRFEPEEVDALLHNRYGQRQAFSVLALLYPWIDYRNKFHQDHLVARGLLQRKKLIAANLDDDAIQFALDRVNDIPNLQMLQGLPNIEKSDTPLYEWLEKAYPNDEERGEYRRRHFIPDGPYGASEFRAFFEARSVLLVNALGNALGIKSDVQQA